MMLLTIVNRATSTLVTAALTAVLVLTGLVLQDHWEERRRQTVVAELDREMTRVNQFLELHQHRLLARARERAREPELRRAVTDATADEVVRQLFITLAAEGVDRVWLGDAAGRTLATCGATAEDRPPSGALPLITRAAAGAEGCALIPAGPTFRLEAAVPVGCPTGRGGVLRLSRRLDAELVSQVERLTGGRLVALPTHRLLTAGEPPAVEGEPTTSPQLVERAESVLAASLPTAPEPRDRVLVQQLQDAGGDPAGLLALVLPGGGSPWERLLLGAWLMASLSLVGVVGHGVLTHSGGPGRGPAAAGLRTLPGPALDPPLRAVAEHLSHHLNNALAVIIGHLELLNGSTAAGDDTARECIDRAWRASDVLRRFQLVSRREPVARVQAVNLGLAWREALRQVAAHHDLTRRFQVTGLAEQNVAALPGDIADLFVCLLENAVEATAPEGLIEVSAERAGGWVKLVFRDDGPGLDAATRARAADLFWSTRGPQHAGLGLPVVDAVVARYGGRWSLESSPGSGCRVRVQLPAWGLER